MGPVLAVRPAAVASVVAVAVVAVAEDMEGLRTRDMGADTVDMQAILTMALPPLLLVPTEEPHHRHMHPRHHLMGPRQHRMDPRHHRMDPRLMGVAMVATTPLTRILTHRPVLTVMVPREVVGVIADITPTADNCRSALTPRLLCHVRKTR